MPTIGGMSKPSLTGPICLANGAAQVRWLSALLTSRQHGTNEAVSWHLSVRDALLQTSSAVSRGLARRSVAALIIQTGKRIPTE